MRAEINALGFSCINYSERENSLNCQNNEGNLANESRCYEIPEDIRSAFAADIRDTKKVNIEKRYTGVYRFLLKKFKKLLK